MRVSIVDFIEEKGERTLDQVSREDYVAIKTPASKFFLVENYASRVFSFRRIHQSDCGAFTTKRKALDYAMCCEYEIHVFKTEEDLYRWMGEE